MKLFKEIAQIKDKQVGRIKDITAMGAVGPPLGSDAVEEEAARELEVATDGAANGDASRVQEDLDSLPDPQPNVLRRIPQGYGESPSE